MLMYQITNLSFLHSDNPPQDIWSRYYNQKDKYPDYQQLTNPEIAQENDKIFVFESSFISLESHAIYIIGQKTPKLLHSFCFFDSCSLTAIYYNCKGSIVQDKFCAINISTENAYGLASYTSLRGEINSNNLNYIIESCVSLCRNEDLRCTIFMAGGFCGLFSSNISKNTVSENSGFTTERTSGCFVVNFSTFENNYAHQACCINHFGGEINHYYHCNIVNNSQGGNMRGCIDTFDFEVIFEKCTILGDYGNGTQFTLSGYYIKLTIINSHSDIVNVECNTEDYTVISFHYSFTNELNTLHHISLKKCQAINDIKNATNQPKHDKHYCQMKREETYDIYVYSTLYQIFGQITLCIIFETK